MNLRKRTKRSLLIMNILVTVVLIGSCTRAPAPEQIADVIYTGGDIVTINDSQPTAEAIAVKDGKIVAVGTKANVLKHKGAATKMVDLRGKTLLPGFIDAPNPSIQRSAA
jgi:hypothetical protein